MSKSPSLECNDNKCDTKCKIGKFTLFYDDFRCGFQPDNCNSPYTFIPLGDTISNDGQILTHPECLTINSSPYMFTSPLTPIDHLKFFTTLKTPFNAPKQGEIVFECIVSLLQTGLAGVPQSIIGSPITGVNNVNSDLRLASGKFAISDHHTMLDFGFLLTNEDIYISYELLPLSQNHTGFIQTIPIGKRNIADPLNDFVKLAIGYNEHDNYVRWSINDVEVYRINRLGFPLQRNTRIIQYDQPNTFPSPSTLSIPRRFTAGFGTVSFMDGYQPQNPGAVPNAGLLDFSASEVNPLQTKVDGSLLPATFLALYNSAGFNGSNFGQGAILRLKYFTIYLIAPEQRSGCFTNLSCCKQSLLLSRCQQNAIPGVRSADNLYQYQCRGYIDNDDECCEHQCNCLFEHEHTQQCMKGTNPHYVPTDRSESEVRQKMRKQLETLI